MTSIGIKKEIAQSVVSKIDEALGALAKSPDPRQSYSQIATLHKVVRYLPEFQDSPEIRFTTFIFWSVIGASTWSDLDEAGDRWMATNKDEMAELHGNMVEYLRKVRQAFDSDDGSVLLEASKSFLFNDVALRVRLPPKG